MTKIFKIHPIGVVRKQSDDVFIIVRDRYRDALLGLEGFSHMVVLYWFHENDTLDDRNLLQVHPRGDRKNPLTGVFATHSPKRPNLIAVTRCRIISIQGATIRVDAIDAYDRSPVIDIKCYIPGSGNKTEVTVPDWV